MECVWDRVVFAEETDWNEPAMSNIVLGQRSATCGSFVSLQWFILAFKTNKKELITWKYISTVTARFTWSEILFFFNWECWEKHLEKKCVYTKLSAKNICICSGAVVLLSEGGRRRRRSGAQCIYSRSSSLAQHAKERTWIDGVVNSVSWTLLRVATHHRHHLCDVYWWKTSSNYICRCFQGHLSSVHSCTRKGFGTNATQAH